MLVPYQGLEVTVLSSSIVCGIPSVNVLLTRMLLFSILMGVGAATGPPPTAPFRPQSQLVGSTTNVALWPGASLLHPLDNCIDCQLFSQRVKHQVDPSEISPPSQLEAVAH